LAESQLTQRVFAQIIRRIERLASHPTVVKAYPGAEAMRSRGEAADVSLKQA